MLTVLLGRFFCGWICPLGAGIDLLDALAAPLRRLNPLALGAGRLKARLARSPLPLFLLGLALVSAFSPLAALPFLHPNVWLLRILSLSAPGLAFLGFLILGAAVSRRWWCAGFCPLGALYGLLGRLAALRLRIKSCSACGICETCPMGAAHGRQRRVSAELCILCFDIENRCPVSGFELGRRPHRPAHPVKRRDQAEGLLASRRIFLMQSAGLLAGLAGGGLLSNLAATGPGTQLLRPPGVTSELAFLERCLRCQQCVRSCPNGILKSTGLEAGFPSLFTPRVVFRPMGCDYLCQICQQVCPNGAIPRQSLEEKQHTPMGLAILNREHCVVYKEGRNCLVCEEFCPVPDKAIHYTTTQGSGAVLKQPYVVEDRCIGCGLCEAACPADPVAIRVVLSKNRIA